MYICQHGAAVATHTYDPDVIMFDMFDRGVEAAKVFKEMVDGMKPENYTIRLSLVAQSVTQLTSVYFPYGDLIRCGQKFLDEDIFNVRILSEFASGDTPKNVMTFTVQSLSMTEYAKAAAEKLAA